MAEKKDCFIKGKIYIGVAEPLPSGTYSYNHAIPKWEEKIKGLTSYPVIGNHSFKDGQEVTGLYDLKRKGNMSGGQAVLTTVHDADFKPENIVAISSTPPDELDREAKELYNMFITIDDVADLVLPHTIAKQCAIIHIQGLIDENDSMFKMAELHMDARAIIVLSNRLSHLNNLKQRIESL